MRYLLCISFFCSMAFAVTGDKDGSGGHGGICFGNDGQTTVRSLDWIEAELDGKKPNLGGPGLSFEQKIDLVFSRIAERDPVQAKHRREEMDHFLANVKFVDKDYPLIGDHATARLPAGCALLQLAVHRFAKQSAVVVGLNDTVFEITKKWWDKLDTDNQVALAFHEVLYSRASWDEQVTSVAIRDFLGYALSGNGFSHLTKQMFFRFTADALLPYGFNDEFELEPVHPKPASDVRITGGRFNPEFQKSEWVTPHARVEITEGTRLRMQSGNALAPQCMWVKPQTFVLDGKEYQVPADTLVGFYDDLKIGGFSNLSNSFIEFQGKKLKWSPIDKYQSRISFHPSGRIRTFYLHQKAVLKTASGMEEFPPGSHLFATDETQNVHRIGVFFDSVKKTTGCDGSY